jgi:hypothetical protein
MALLFVCTIRWSGHCKWQPCLFAMDGFHVSYGATEFVSFGIDSARYPGSRNSRVVNPLKRRNYLPHQISIPPWKVTPTFLYSLQANSEPFLSVFILCSVHKGGFWPIQSSREAEDPWTGNCFLLVDWVSSTRDL